MSTVVAQLKRRRSQIGASERPRDVKVARALISFCRSADLPSPISFSDIEGDRTARAFERAVKDLIEVHGERGLMAASLCLAALEVVVAEKGPPGSVREMLSGVNDVIGEALYEAR